MERRFRDDVFFTVATELESVVVGEQQQRNGNERLLFDDGQVFPSAADGDVDEGASKIL